MKSSDFRIGNIIENFNCKITRLLPNKCSYKKGEINIYSIDYEKINPVLLNEYLLLNFGFVKGVVYQYEIEKYSIQINNIHNRYFKIYFYGKIIKREIYFVHELQNLIFALTGEELMLKQ